MNDSSIRLAEQSSSIRLAEQSSSIRLAEQSSTIRLAEQSSSIRLAEQSSSIRLAEQSSSIRLAEQSSSIRLAEPSWIQDSGQIALSAHQYDNRLSTPVHYRPDGYSDDINPQMSREYDLRSENSEGMDDSVVSSVVDKFGFMHSEATLEDREDKEETEAVDIDLLRRRETKWLFMLEHWDDYMMTNYKKIRDRCRKGIPPSVRSRAWLYLCGAKYQMDHPGLKNAYKKLSNRRCSSKWLDDIEKDLHRNFPTHELFGGAYERLGQQELYNVLKAYTVLNPVAGYCQAQAPIAALLLMHMPAEHALWCLVAICDRYIPGYYSNELVALQLDGDILFGLLKKIAPGVYRHLKVQEISPTMYMTEWFLCIFSRNLPWPSVLRIWDMFFCEGVKVLFRVGLVLLKYSLPLRVRKKCPSLYETLMALKEPPPEVLKEEFLIPAMLTLKITEDDMEREHRKQLEKRRKNQSCPNLS